MNFSCILVEALLENIFERFQIDIMAGDTPATFQVRLA